MRTACPAVVVVFLAAAACPCGADEIHYAAACGRLDRLKAILAESPDRVNQPDATGMTPLHWAALLHENETVEYLLAHGADVGAADAHGRTSLHLAAQVANVEAAKRILAKGAKADARDHHGATPADRVPRSEIGEAQQAALTALLGQRTPRAEGPARPGETPAKPLPQFVAEAASAGDTEALARHLDGDTGLIGARDAAGRTVLHLACAAGKTEAVALLCERRASLDAPDAEGRTPLHLACLGGHAEAAASLLAAYRERSANDLLRHSIAERMIRDDPRGGVAATARSMLSRMLGAYLDARDAGGRTALHGAAEGGHRAVVQCLIENGANVDAIDGQAKSALALAQAKNLAAIVDLLKQAGAVAPVPEGRPIPKAYVEKAASTRDGLELKALLDAVPRLASVQLDEDQVFVRRPYLLHWVMAPRYHHATAGELAAHLLKHGASVDAREERGPTALHLACLFQRVDAVQVLLENGADPGAIDQYDRSPLICVFAAPDVLGNRASAVSAQRIIKMLVARGADVNRLNRYGNSALASAARSAPPYTVWFLLEAGAKPALPGAQDLSALHCVAMREGDSALGVAEMLLARGAPANPPSRNGHTPLHAAASEGRGDLAALFLKHGADPNAADRDRRLPLHRAATASSAGAVEVLLGVSNLSARDERGCTPLHALVSAGPRSDQDRVGLVRKFLAAGADPSIADARGLTPLDLAKNMRWTDAVAVLEGRAGK